MSGLAVHRCERWRRTAGANCTQLIASYEVLRLMADPVGGGRDEMTAVKGEAGRGEAWASDDKLPLLHDMSLLVKRASMTTSWRSALFVVVSVF